MGDFLVTNDAENDILSIWEHIAERNARAADRLIQRFYRSFSLLADHPLSGHVRADLTEKPLRFWSVGDYMLVYNPTDKPLEIVRVLHGYRNLASVLKKLD